jgi:L-seryl-tRNA(Ser) seleniumtransferase
VKGEAPFQRLPSLNDLLNHPRVRDLVGRVHESTLAQRASGFLEELRATWTQRAEHWDWPSSTHLAERFARRLLGELPEAAAAVNGTGLVIGDPDLTAPLPEAALHARWQAGAEYARREAIAEQCRRTLADACQAEAAAAFATVEAGALAVLASAAGCGAAHALDARTVLPRTAWPDLAARAGVNLHANAGPQPASAAGAAPLHLALSRPRRAEGDASQSGDELAWLAEAARRAHAHGGTLIDVAPSAGLLDPADFGLPAVPTIAARLAAGADLVLCDGNGLLGGPRLAVLIGTEAALRSVLQHPIAAALAAPPDALVALTQTVRAYAEPQQAVHEAPCWQLLAAPVESLRLRAERLAALVGATPGVATATAASLEGVWLDDVDGPLAAPSWGVALEPAQGTADALAERLRHGAAAVLGRVVDQQWILDLRSVFPRWDHQLPQLVGAACGGGSRGDRLGEGESVADAFLMGESQ